MKLLKIIIRKIYNKYLSLTVNRNYNSKITYLRKEGAQIGEGTRLICDVSSFGSEPYLIKVGNDCLLADGIHLITHDGGVKVLSDMNYFNGERMDIIAPINIGNNVYIGTGACIMPGVTIGNNVIIGAAAVVTKNIPDNSVAVGVPAKVIKSIDQYYEQAKLKGKLYPTAKMNRKEKKEYFKDKKLV